MADYAHGSGYDGRSDHSVSSALTTPWPTSFDINTDILKQDKAATFRREFKAAVRSRKLLEAVETVLPTIAEVVAENPGVEKALIMEHYDKLCDRRRDTHVIGIWFCFSNWRRDPVWSQRVGGGGVGAFWKSVTSPACLCV